MMLIGKQFWIHPSDEFQARQYTFTEETRKRFRVYQELIANVERASDKRKGKKK